MRDDILAVLDPDQYVVATSFEQPVVVLAGAGSGKTRAITHRVANAVAEGHYQAAATLAVTFTTRAAGEMRSRLAGLGVRGTTARTIHAAALRQCQYFWPQVYSTDFPAVAENTFATVARSASQVLGGAETPLIRDLITEITWAKSSNVSPERYAETAGDRSVQGTTPAQVGAVFSAYEKAKSGQGVVDFHDILLCAAHLMASYPDVAATIRDGYRHFVVDEYQDVSAIQHRLIELWVDGRDDLCVVGDPRQSIHGFAGADASHLMGMARRDDVTVVQLDRNYRSTPEICAVGNAVLGGRSALRAARPAGPDPQFREYPSEAAEAQAAADLFTTAHREGTPWSEMAALYRINSQSAQLEAALTRAGVPYTVRGTERFYERPEIRRALHVISRAATTAAADADASEFITECMQGAGWGPEPPSAPGAQRDAWESLNALVDMLRAEEFSSPQQVADWVSERASWQAGPVAEAVTLSSMHASKGLEWDVVAVVGVRESLVPFSLATTPEELEEERRLLHVAVTRARDVLAVSWAQGQSGKGYPSRFIRSLIPAAQGRTGGRRRGERIAQTPLCTVCGKPLLTGPDRKLRRHADCEVDVDPILFASLKQWRKEEAEAASVPAFVVFTDATLLAIAEARPTSPAELLKLPGVGRVKVERYGESCLEVVRRAS